MVLKSLIGASFACLAVMSFSANAAPMLMVLPAMTLSTEANSSLLIDSPASGIPVSQVGQMTGRLLGLDWVLDYTSPLNYTLSNTFGVYSQGTYTDFAIDSFTFTTQNSGTSTSTGVFTDSVLGAIIDVTSVGTWSGSFGQPINWEGTGTFTFRSNAPFAFARLVPLNPLEPSAVPIPAAALLFAPALLGFMGLRRKAKNSIA